MPDFATLAIRSFRILATALLFLLRSLMLLDGLRTSDELVAGLTPRRRRLTPDMSIEFWEVVNNLENVLVVSDPDIGRRDPPSSSDQSVDGSLGLCLSSATSSSPSLVEKERGFIQ